MIARNNDQRSREPSALLKKPEHISQPTVLNLHESAASLDQTSFLSLEADGAPGSVTDLRKIYGSEPLVTFSPSLHIGLQLIESKQIESLLIRDVGGLLVNVGVAWNRDAEPGPSAAARTFLGCANVHEAEIFKHAARPRSYGCAGPVNRCLIAGGCQGPNHAAIDMSPEAFVVLRVIRRIHRRQD